MKYAQRRRENDTMRTNSKGLAARPSDRAARFASACLLRLGAGAGIVLLTACSEQQVYEEIQRNRLDACDRNSKAAAEACRADFDLPYEEYRRDLEKIDSERSKADAR